MPEETNTTPAPTRMCGRGLGNTRDMRLICGEQKVLILVLMRQTQVTASRQVQILMQSQIFLDRLSTYPNQSCTLQRTLANVALQTKKVAHGMLLRELGRDVNPEIYGDATARVTAGATGSWTRQLDQRVAKTAFLAAEDFGHCEKWPHDAPRRFRSTPWPRRYVSDRRGSD